MKPKSLNIGDAIPYNKSIDWREEYKGHLIEFKLFEDFKKIWRK